MSLPYGAEITVGDVTVIPLSDDDDSRDFEPLSRFIPTTRSAFHREPPFVHARPHALLVTRGEGASPWEIDDAVLAKVDTFLALVRLVYAATIQSYFEVRGEPGWVVNMPTQSFTFRGIGGILPSMMNRVVMLASTNVQPLEKLAAMIEAVDEDQPTDMAATS
jgi:hypothetical protein